MKSAYEMALERMEQQGIERPRAEALSVADREQLAEVRRTAEAKLAELEILHKDRLAKITDPAKRQEEESDFRQDVGRVESHRDREIERIRSGHGSAGDR